MLIIGRSIGSGPAMNIASLYSNIGALALISPFISLKEAVRHIAGNLAASLLRERFDNKEKAAKVSAPCLIIHGLKDGMIPAEHSLEITGNIKGFSMVKVI